MNTNQKAKGFYHGDISSAVFGLQFSSSEILLSFSAPGLPLLEPQGALRNTVTPNMGLPSLSFLILLDLSIVFIHCLVSSQMLSNRFCFCPTFLTVFSGIVCQNYLDHC